MLPVEALRRRGGAGVYDLAVVGAGFAGLTVATILARSGARVVVFDAARRPGGEIQTLTHQGIAIDLGPTRWPAAPVARALAAAGVADAVQAWIPARHAFHAAAALGGASVGEVRCLPIPGAATTPATLDAVRDLLGVAPRAFAGLGELWIRLAALPAAELDGLSGTPIREWSEIAGLDPPVRAALLRLLVLLGADRPDQVDVALLARMVRSLLGLGDDGDVGMPGDHPVAGARCLIQPLVDALLEAGGELRLGTRVVAIGLERGRMRGLRVQREETPFVEEITAPQLVLAIGRESIAALAPAELITSLPASPVVAPARATLGMAWCFRERPVERSGRSLEEPGVVSVVPPLGGAAARRGAGAGLPEDAVATFTWPSHHAPRVCPPGKALLVAHVTLPAIDARDAMVVSAHQGHLRAMVRELHRGVDDLLEMERCWIRAPGAPDPLARGVLPTVAGRLDGVFLAGAEVATSEAAGLGAAAASAIEAATRIGGSA